MIQPADKLASIIDQHNTPACVGIDPVYEKLPPDLKLAVTKGQHTQAKAIGQFASGVVQAVAGTVGIVKFQSACFERYGHEGLRELQIAIEQARELGLFVILDAKRGDIGITAEHYANAAFKGPARADALTVSPYLGPDTIEPFISIASQTQSMLFVLARTSNPGSDLFQSQKLADGRTVSHMIADAINTLGQPSAQLASCKMSLVGAVVAATKPADALELRERMPSTFFLIPGYGAQGGTIADLRHVSRPASNPSQSVAERGIIVTASRSVIYPNWSVDASHWTLDIRASAKQLVRELSAL